MPGIPHPSALLRLAVVPAAIAAFGAAPAAHALYPAAPTHRATPPRPDPVPAGNVEVSIPITNTPQTLHRLCDHLLGPSEDSPGQASALAGLVQETGGTVASASRWCRSYLSLRAHP